jgi:hypothetical protein
MGSSIGGLVGGVAGSFFGAPTVGAALGSGIGGLIGGSAQGGSAAQAQGNAGNSIYGAGQYGQTSSQFNPIGITTNFGKSSFTRDPTTGQITNAGYTLDPRLQGISNNVIGNAVNYDPNQVAQAAQPLFGASSSAFNLGNQYLAQSPQQASADYLALQRNLMAPGYEQSLSNIRNQVYQTGRAGLGVGGTTEGGLMQTNPELAAFYNSKANNDRALAAQADQYGQQRAQFGLNLFGTGGGLLSQVPALTSAGYSPLNTILGTANSVEGMGQNAFDLSTTLGAGQSTANANAARFGLSGATSAAPFQIANQSYNPLANVLQGTSGSNMGQLGGQLGNYVGDLIGGGSGMGLLNSSNSSQDYLNAIGATSNSPLSSSNAYANEWWM